MVNQRNESVFDSKPRKEEKKSTNSCERDCKNNNIDRERGGWEWGRESKSEREKGRDRKRTTETERVRERKKGRERKR